MDFIRLCALRESCRDFTGEKVSNETIKCIVEAGRIAPSACNSQPWHFYVIKGEKLDLARKGIQWMSANKFTDKATAFIVITGEKENYAEKIGERLFGRDFSNIDIGICIENMALCASSLGVGSCIIGAFRDKEILQAIGIEKNDKAKVKLILALGMPSARISREKKRKKIDEVVTFVD